MSPRKKSRLERLLSFNRHRQRWGAAKYASAGGNFAAMKAHIIDNGAAVQTRGSDKSLERHLQSLRCEFSGQPELLWHHARLIVLIRREFRTAETYAQFRTLWDAERSFLCEHLNVRWLIAAADTFAEHDRDSEVRAIAMMTTLLANTIKLHESERHLCKVETISVDPARIARVQKELVPLFEGMSCFTVGTDDTLRNMRWRLQKFFEVEPTGAMLKTVWDRCQIESTVFSRMRKLHQRSRTQWWDEGHPSA